VVLVFWCNLVRDKIDINIRLFMLFAIASSGSNVVAWGRSSSNLKLLVMATIL